MKIVILGPPGSGKSTQAAILAQKLALPHLDSGETLRKIKEEPSALGRRVKKHLEKDHLVPDRDILAVVKKELAKSQYEKGWVIDGFPRTLSQAKKAALPVNFVFYIKVAKDECIKRLLKRGREDDTRLQIKERLKEYFEKTVPVLDYYQEKGVLLEVDGEKPELEVHQEILSKL